jgi:hypothetical protein
MDPTRQLAIRAFEFEADAKHTPREQISQNVVRLQIALAAIFNVKVSEGVESDGACGSVDVPYSLDGSGSAKGLVDFILPQQAANTANFQNAACLQSAELADQTLTPQARFRAFARHSAQCKESRYPIENMPRRAGANRNRKSSSRPNFRPNGRAPSQAKRAAEAAAGGLGRQDFSIQLEMKNQRSSPATQA